MHPKNKTQYSTLNRLAKDPRVVEIWTEGEDGIWVSLAKGWNNEGCSTVHAYTPQKVIEEFEAFVTEGPTY